jgi:hypothetical protein
VAHGCTLQEGVSGAGVQQGEEALALDHHGQQHRVVSLDSCKSMHRNHKGVSVGSLIDELLLGHSRVRSVLCWLPVVVHKVVRL